MARDYTQIAPARYNRDMEPRALLRHLFDIAVAAVAAPKCVPPALARIAKPKGRTLVLGGGKAAAAMAKAVEDARPGPIEGLVVTRYGHGLATRAIEVIEAAHPVPDDVGERAARRMLELAHGLGADDQLIMLLSGGASALMVRPADGIPLAEKQQVTRALLRSGANIGEMNTVRKHLSAIKGGRLALAAHPAEVVTLMVSDVPGDEPAVIGSGPTVPDPTTYADARAVLAKYRIDPPPAVQARLAAGSDETPKPGDPRLARASAIMIATPKQALAAAAKAAVQAGYRPVVLGDAIEGEARDVGAAQARLALGQQGRVALISGGETTVTVRGQGRGGRNAEFLLGLTIALAGAPGIHALAADTDGIDGSEDNAGALCAPDTLARAKAGGLDAGQRLADNDAYGFFAALGDLVVTGPTRTNVNDFRVILIDR
jgi:hydroxypyruvate reductase